LHIAQAIRRAREHAVHVVVTAVELQQWATKLTHSHGWGLVELTSKSLQPFVEHMLWLQFLRHSRLKLV
jgi:hypothetical protein